MRSLLLCLITLSASQAASPIIQSVLNGANYQPVIASATWIAITGSNLASGTRTWASGDFIGGNLPVKLDDVQVSINGKAAYVYFISPGQLNVLGPDDPAIGTVSVQVTNSQGTSNAYSANKQSASPALFAYGQLGGRFAIIQAAQSYGLVAPPGLLGSTVKTATTSPGANLILYATGLGAVTPSQATGQPIQAAAATALPVTVTISGQNAPVQYAGLIGSGLYQINLSVPAVRTGDAAIIVSVGGRQSTADVYLPVQAYADQSGQSTPALVNCLTGPVDYVTFNTALLSSGQTVDTSIGGTSMCPSCSVKSPLYPEFTARLETALERRETVRACYDNNGNIFQITVLHR